MPPKSTDLSLLPPPQAPTEDVECLPSIQSTKCSPEPEDQAIQDKSSTLEEKRSISVSVSSLVAATVTQNNDLLERPNLLPALSSSSSSSSSSSTPCRLTEKNASRNLARDKKRAKAVVPSTHRRFKTAIHFFIQAKQEVAELCRLLSIQQPTEHEAEAVTTPYGPGVVYERRTDGVVVVELAFGRAFIQASAVHNKKNQTKFDIDKILLEWKNLTDAERQPYEQQALEERKAWNESHPQPALFTIQEFVECIEYSYTHIQPQRPESPEFYSTLCNTPFGRGFVLARREDGVLVVRLGFDGSPATAFLQPEAVQIHRLRVEEVRRLKRQVASLEQVKRSIQLNHKRLLLEQKQKAAADLILEGLGPKAGEKRKRRAGHANGSTSFVPMQPRTAWQWYLKTAAAAVRQQHPDYNWPQITQALSRSWRVLTLSERETYDAKARADRTRWSTETSHYTLSKGLNKTSFRDYKDKILRAYRLKRLKVWNHDLSQHPLSVRNIKDEGIRKASRSCKLELSRTSKRSLDECSSLLSNHSPKRLKTKEQGPNIPEPRPLSLEEVNRQRNEALARYRQKRLKRWHGDLSRHPLARVFATHGPEHEDLDPPSISTTRSHKRKMTGPPKPENPKRISHSQSGTDPTQSRLAYANQWYQRFITSCQTLGTLTNNPNNNPDDPNSSHIPGISSFSSAGLGMELPALVKLHELTGCPSPAPRALVTGGIMDWDTVVRLLRQMEGDRGLYQRLEAELRIWRLKQLGLTFTNVKQILSTQIAHSQGGTLFKSSELALPSSPNHSNNLNSSNDPGITPSFSSSSTTLPSSSNNRDNANYSKHPNNSNTSTHNSLQPSRPSSESSSSSAHVLAPVEHCIQYQSNLYTSRVRDTFQTSPAKFQEFTTIVQGLTRDLTAVTDSQHLDRVLSKLAQKLRKLFKGHQDLVTGFYQLLPASFRTRIGQKATQKRIKVSKQSLAVDSAVRKSSKNTPHDHTVARATKSCGQSSAKLRNGMRDRAPMPVLVNLAGGCESAVGLVKSEQRLLVPELQAEDVLLEAEEDNWTKEVLRQWQLKEQCVNPTQSEVERLSQRTGLTVPQIRAWFSDVRKRKRAEFRKSQKNLKPKACRACEQERTSSAAITDSALRTGLGHSCGRPAPMKKRKLNVIQQGTVPPRQDAKHTQSLMLTGPVGLKHLLNTSLDQLRFPAKCHTRPSPREGRSDPSLSHPFSAVCYQFKNRV